MPLRREQKWHIKETIINMESHSVKSLNLKMKMDKYLKNSLIVKDLSLNLSILTLTFYKNYP